MDFGLTREQEILRDTVREFAQRELAPEALALDEKGEFIHDIIKKTAELGLVGIVTSKEYGGSGMGHLARMIMIEEFSKVYPSLGFFFQTGQIGMYILENFGSEEMKKKYLPSLCQADLTIATASSRALLAWGGPIVSTTTLPETLSRILKASSRAFLSPGLITAGIPSRFIVPRAGSSEILLR